jgi:hypothetical protein
MVRVLGYQIKVCASDWTTFIFFVLFLSHFFCCVVMLFFYVVLCLCVSRR